MTFRSPRRKRIGLGALLAASAIVTTGLVITHVSPLATHVLQVKLNSAVAVAAPPLGGITALPALLSNAPDHRLAILGGSLLQLGLSGSSVPVLQRAVAADPINLALRSALGEALVLSNRGQVTGHAKSEFDAVLATDPNDLIARFYMAHWLLQNGKPKSALVKWVGLMRTVGNDSLWNARLWDAMPAAAEQVNVSPLALRALCTAGM